mmetsp:Transcript_85846/g.243408  ORF Transcript_85846/g.243408 Transcript_85846/m.243408 type:complete len:1053 (-) Transcript_85846:129-3287(-)
MSQIRTLSRQTRDESSLCRHIDSLFAESEAERQGVPAEECMYQPLRAGGAEAVPKTPSRRRSTGARVVVVDAPEECGEAAGDESTEETGSECWDSGAGDAAAGPRLDDDFDEEERPLATRRRASSLRTQTFMDRLKAKRSAKSDFGFHVNLAFKGAVFVVLGNLPILVEPLRNKFPKHFQSVLGAVGLYVVFTFYKNVGDTLSFAFQGVTGALLAVVNMWMVTAVVGTTPDSGLAGSFVWLDLVAFIWLVLWLNFDGNTRNIALGNHVSYVMLILRPEDSDLGPKSLMPVLSVSEFLRFETADVANLCVVVAASLLSVLAALLPLMPVLPSDIACQIGDALRWAEEETEDLASQMGQLVMDAVKGFGADHESLAVDGFIAKAMHMHQRLERLDVLSEAAWWEVKFPLMRQRNLRLRAVKEMHDLMTDIIDDVIILLYAVKYKAFNENHEDMMDEILVPLEDLAQFFSDELSDARRTLSEVIACSQDPRKRALRLKVHERKKHLITELGEAYMKQLNEMLYAETEEPALQGGSAAGAPQGVCRVIPMGGSAASTATSLFGGHSINRSHNNSVLLDTMEESHFVYRMIIVVDRLISRLDRQVGNLHDRMSIYDWICTPVKHMLNPEVLYLKEHVIFAIRQSVTMVVCFSICKHYYRYSPTMVVTQALLVSESSHVGSMLKKNLGRLQGVVIGTIFPHLFYDWFSECSVSHNCTLAIILFFFEWLALYVYYSSEDFGYVGCLVAAFGASAMCQGCGEEGTTLKSLYLIMEQNALGIAILTAVDMVFSPERASDLANRQMCHDQEVTKSNRTVGILPLLQYGLVSALKMELHPDDQDLSSCQKYALETSPSRCGDWSVRTMKQFRLAAKLCDEACAEPRYMRRPWPSKLYQEVLKVSKGLRADILALKDAIDGPDLSLSGAGIDNDLSFDDLKEFKRFTRKLQRAFNKVSHAVRLALRHFDEERGEQPRRATEILQEAENLKIPTDEDLKKLSRALLQLPQVQPEPASAGPGDRSRLSIKSRILADVFCRMSVAVCVLKSSSRRLKKLNTAVVDCL